ncbi:MAG: hypothetical protein K8L99_33345 [Anaerolineae bacterium]|nr:hypothetical protein [Anaerolineae bacterium]
MTEHIKYATVIEPVFEVTLSGIANAHIWRDYLRQEGYENGNTADEIDITISAVDSRFKGIRFQEFSISLKIHENRYFLANAYNSIALFAFAERTFFRTPYYKGDIEVYADRLCLGYNGQRLFEASLAAQAPLLTSVHHCEDLFVALPKHLRKKPLQPHFFYARLEGLTEVYSGNDVAIQIMPRQEDRMMTLLEASQFQVNDWHIRRNARHSKSKTYME